MKDLIDQFRKLGFIEKAIISVVFALAPLFLVSELYNAYQFFIYFFG